MKVGSFLRKKEKKDKKKGHENDWEDGQGNAAKDGRC